MVRSSRPNPRKHRAALLLKGYTLAEFAARHGFALGTVKAAVRGVRKGPRSRAVIAAIHAAPTQL